MDTEYYHIHRSLIDTGHFTEEQENLLLKITQVESGFSFLSSLFIIISFLRFKKLRKFSFTLVVMLSFSDMGCCVSYFMGNPTSSTTLCTFQGFLQTFFELSSLLWVTLIAWTLWRKVVLQRDSRQDLVKYSVFSFGISLIAAILPLTTSSYGSAGGWCWITSTGNNVFNKGNLWRFCLFYFPLWFVIFFNFVSYVWVIRSVRRLMTTQPVESHHKYDKMMRRLKCYPVILCCCWAGATINRFQNAFDPDNPIYFLYVLQVSTRSLQGVLNAIAYGFTSPVIREWREGGCCCERGEEGELDYGVVGGQINRQNAENNASRNSDPPKNNYEDNSSGSDDLNNSNNSLKKPLIPQTKQHKHKHSPPKENQKAPLPPARKNSYNNKYHLTVPQSSNGQTPFLPDGPEDSAVRLSEDQFIVEQIIAVEV